jgi:hypothetical protein
MLFLFFLLPCFSLVLCLLLFAVIRWILCLEELCLVVRLTKYIYLEVLVTPWLGSFRGLRFICSAQRARIRARLRFSPRSKAEPGWLAAEAAPLEYAAALAMRGLATGVQNLRPPRPNPHLPWFTFIPRPGGDIRLAFLPQAIEGGTTSSWRSRSPHAHEKEFLRLRRGLRPDHGLSFRRQSFVRLGQFK